jgi:hypothetical protein
MTTTDHGAKPLAAPHRLQFILDSRSAANAWSRFTLHFYRRSARNPDGDRKTMAVCDCHDLAPFAAARWANAIAPLFALLNEASMKASSSPNCPRARRSSHSAHSKPSSTLSAATAGNAGDRSDRNRSVTEDPATVRPCKESTTPHSAPGGRRSSGHRVHRLVAVAVDPTR